MQNRTFLVLLKPIFCEKLKTAPPKENSPPQTFGFPNLAEKSVSISVKTFFFFLIVGGKNVWIFELSEKFRLNFRANRVKLIQEQWKFGSRLFALFSLFQKSPPPLSKSWLRAWVGRLLNKWLVDWECCRQWCRSLLSIGGDNLQFYPNFLLFSTFWGMNLDHDFVQMWKFSEDKKKKKRMEHFFSQIQVKTKKRSSTRIEHFFPNFTLRCTPIQTIGGDISPLVSAPLAVIVHTSRPKRVQCSCSSKRLLLGQSRHWSKGGSGSRWRETKHLLGNPPFESPNF